jgi:predicted PolB exonuclease-like 3'-5' exonuclease
MEANSHRRYKLSDDTALRLGLKLNENKRYRINKFQEQLLLTGFKQPKILIYDIETSRAVVKTWWSGKQYVNGDQIIREPKIITIAWKWFGTDEVYVDHWSMDKHCDKAMLERFLRDYNLADMIIGQNNDRFDNRWINGRALKYDLDVNTQVRSLDLMKENKRLFRVPGYSMKFINKYLGIKGKLEHEGIKMWDMIEDGSLDEQKEYMQKMIDYNRQDIIATEEMYLRIRKYIGTPTHIGKFMGGSKYDCPTCGSTHVEPKRITYTSAGTLQHIMHCTECESHHKISNRTYLDWLEDNKCFS